MLKILFQGDSVTDCGRDRSFTQPAAEFGYGYVNLIASKLLYEYPDVKVYNRAVSGNRIVDMYSRWIEDMLNIDCDILSVLCGINDVGFGLRMNMGADTEKFKFVYDIMLKEAKEKNPDLKLVLCEPFLMKITENTPEAGKDIVENWELWSSTLLERRQVIKELADKYNGIFVPFAEKFEEALKKAPAQHWSADCIHVTNAGHELMARTWLEYVRPEKMI